MTSEKLTVIPENPTYKHVTGVVTDKGNGGIDLQTEKGKLSCNIDPSKASGMNVGDAVTTILQLPPNVKSDEYIQSVISGTSDSQPTVNNFEQFSKTVTNIGENLKQAPSSSGIKPTDVAITVVNELGAICKDIPADTKANLEVNLSKTIGESMPVSAWTGWMLIRVRIWHRKEWASCLTRLLVRCNLRLLAR